MSVTTQPSKPGTTACAPESAPLVTEPLSVDAATRLAQTLKALADPARLRLLSLIAAHEGGEACVCDLTVPIGLSQPTVSHHLKKLVDAGLLHREQRGIWAYYTLQPAALDPLTQSLHAVAAMDDGPLAT